MMRKYEFVFVLPKLEEKAKKELLKKIKDLFVEQKGKIEKEDNWGLKQLAYRIKKQTEGDYFLFLVSFKPGIFGKIEEKLKQEENMLRYLLVRVD